MKTNKEAAKRLVIEDNRLSQKIVMFIPSQCKCAYRMQPLPSEAESWHFIGQAHKRCMQW